MTESPLTLREALARYLAANRLPADGGYQARWVRLSIGPLPFAIPNTAGRRRVVPAHDLHHVVTGYATDIAGEGELAAWELAAGCRDRTALHLELRVLGFALLGWPRRMWQAYLRGRHCRNLLGVPCQDGAFLSRSVASLRSELGLEHATAPPTRADRLGFARWAALAVAIVWGPLVPLAALAWWWLR
jgi:hypothetical protein